jgi:serine phosphatase RsbU (regulator of sigma subunit)
VRRIIEELQNFRGSAQVKDDQTLLAVHFARNP